VPPRRRGLKRPGVILPAVLAVLLAAVGGGAYLGFDLKGNNSPQQQAAGLTPPTGKSSGPSSPAASSAAAVASTSPAALAPATPSPLAPGAVPSAPAAGATVSSTEYSTPDPFPLCDPNGGQWLLVNMTPQSGGCVPNMQADANNAGYMFGTVTSFPQGLPLTASNTVTVSGEINAPGDLDCLGSAEGSSTGGYIGLLCNNGQWYINSVVNLGTKGVVVGKQLDTGSYPYSSSTTYDISLTFGSGTGKLGVTFSQGSASPLSVSFSTGQFTPDAVGYALNNVYGNGSSAATISGFTYSVN
jgi:hypothetical protein